VTCRAAAPATEERAQELPSGSLLLPPHPPALESHGGSPSRQGSLIARRSMRLASASPGTPPSPGPSGACAQAHGNVADVTQVSERTATSMGLIVSLRLLTHSRSCADGARSPAGGSPSRRSFPPGAPWGCVNEAPADVYPAIRALEAIPCSFLPPSLVKLKWTPLAYFKSMSQAEALSQSPSSVGKTPVPSTCTGPVSCVPFPHWAMSM